MLNKPENHRQIIFTVSEILKADKQDELHGILSEATITVELTGYDNWNNGTNLYTVYLKVDIQTFVQIRDRIQNIETTFLEKFNIATRHLDNESISNVLIVPKSEPKVDWSRLDGTSTKEKLTDDVNFLKNIMVSVATGGKRIQDANEEYKAKYKSVNSALQKLDWTNPNPYKDLWEWYGKWSTDFAHYHQRRTFIGQMYNSLIQNIEENTPSEMINVTIDLTDWERIERSINEIKIRQAEAKTEEQFQVVGLLSRETIITLAQTVFIPEKHPILDGKDISKTDAKRMLEAYIAVELLGPSNETLRRYAKATLDLANELAHKRTATKKDTSLCATATISLLNLIGTIEGRI